MTTIRNIRKYVNEAVNLFKPKQVILFGSYAYGTQKPDSDVDLLFIMDYQGRAPEQAFKIRKSIKRDFPLDIIVRKPSEIAVRIKKGDFFLKEAVNNGKVLYE